MKSAAVITIQKPGAMTTKGRRDIVNWLRKQAAHLLRYGDNYNDTGNFTARYRYLK